MSREIKQKEGRDTEEGVVGGEAAALGVWRPCERRFEGGKWVVFFLAG